MNIGRQDNNGFMGQVNRGIADTLQSVSPFNAIRSGVKELTGSPLLGEPDVNYADAFRETGIATADQAPEGVLQHAGRGMGQAAAVAPLAAVGAAGVSTHTSPVVASVADDIYRGLVSRFGLAAESLAGGVSGAAGEAVREQGGPEWLASTAEVAAPMAGLPAATATARTVTGGTLRAGNATVDKLPLAGPAFRAGKRIAADVKRGVAPMTEGGAMEVARKRVQDAVGGPERAEAISKGITPDNPLNLTPAQQSADPDLLGLEGAAAAENPGLRDRLAVRDAASRTEAVSDIREGTGSPDDARKFFLQRRRQFGEAIKARTDRVLQMADEEVEATGPQRAQSTNSEQMVAALKQELDAHRGVEARLWGAVPKEALVSTSNATRALSDAMSATPRAQQEDIPAIARDLLALENGLGEETSVAELHGLYSKLREIARAARAGTNQQRNRARIADDIADAILNDLGAIDAQTPAGRAINDARAFSAEMHQLFDQGTVGKILNRTIDGDERIAPETALKRTVGRGREDALVASRDIEAAAPDATDNITDSLRGDFADAIYTPEGKFSPARARTWLRSHREVLQRRYPELMTELQRALKGRTQAAAFTARAKVRSQFDDGTPAGRIASGSPEKAVSTIITATDPGREAARIVNAARKDKTGKALAGLKGAFADYLIGKAGTKDGLSGEELFGLISDSKTNQALRRVFSPKEFANLARITRELRKLDAPRSNTSEVLNSPANQLIETIARIAAVKAAGNMHSGGAGESLQIANMASGRAKRFLQRLTNDRARQILVDAIEDPELMKVILGRPLSLNAPKNERILSRYLTGTVGAMQGE